LPVIRLRLPPYSCEKKSGTRKEIKRLYGEKGKGEKITEKMISIGGGSRTEKFDGLSPAKGTRTGRALL